MYQAPSTPLFCRPDLRGGAPVPLPTPGMGLSEHGLLILTLFDTSCTDAACVFFCIEVWHMKRKHVLDQSQAPIYQALQTFRQMRVVPFDVPGHKRGRGNPELTEFLGQQCVSIDVNSMKPLDNL